MRRIIQSKLFLSIAVVLVFLCVVALWREVKNTITTKKEIKKLEEQAAQLEQKNTDLKQLIEYLNSPDYQERAAREHLNLQAPGEVAIALPEHTTTTADTETRLMTQNQSNAKLWWNYFFALRSNE